MRLEVKNKDFEQKIIVVNSHLFFDKSSLNSGLKKREEQFLKIVDEFNLIDYWKKGYNIFFCGDLNFRLYTPNNITNKGNYNKIDFYHNFKTIGYHITEILKIAHENNIILMNFINLNYIILIYFLS